ncbi:radical SAM protein, partial [Patescibacteria group bacterium]
GFIMTNLESSRFALRQEYFGGLLLDYQKTEFEILESPAFHLLESLQQAKTDIFLPEISGSRLGQTIELLKTRGAIEVSQNDKLTLKDTRLVEQENELPEDHLSSPLKIYDSTTRKCNLTCEHCYAGSGPSFQEDRRTTEQTEKVMEKFFKAGAMEWRFTGGEPTTAPDLFDLIDVAQGFGMKVSLNTNGVWSPRTKQQVFDSGVKDIVISLEGKQGINDKRRMDGVFDSVIKTLTEISQENKVNPENKINVVLNTAIGMDNIQDLGFVVATAANFGFNVNFVPLKPAGRALGNLPDEMLSTQEYMNFASEVQRLRNGSQVLESGIKLGLKHKDLLCNDYTDKSDRPFPFNYSECGALTTAISLLPDGRAFACPFLMDDKRFLASNTVETSVYETWMDPALQHFRNAQKADCGDCTFYMQSCRGSCRAVVILSGGDIKQGKLTGVDPYCFKDLLPDKQN